MCSTNLKNIYRQLDLHFFILFFLLFTNRLISNIMIKNTHGLVVKIWVNISKESSSNSVSDSNYQKHFHNEIHTAYALHFGAF